LSTGSIFLFSLLDPFSIFGGDLNPDPIATITFFIIEALIENVWY